MKQPAKKTPQERLSARKAILQEQCRIREQKLTEDFSCLRENAGRLLLFGLSWLVASGTGTGKQTDATPDKTSALPPVSSVFNWAGIFSTAKTLWPVVWEIAWPILVSQGINRIRQWLFNPKK
ncbi:MAG: hypothetical protein LBJ01_00585 [Tannerella sp.]|jgi:hypothetical protein|nr:hypothetical protein [Tannerella sp.]